MSDDQFRWERVETPGKSGPTPAFRVHFTDDGRPRTAEFFERLSLGARIDALEAFGAPKTDQGGLALQAVTSLALLDGAPPAPSHTRQHFILLMDRLGEAGLEAYMRMLLEVNPPKPSVDAIDAPERAALGN